MKVNIIIPSMGESVVEATISSIFKPDGSVIKNEEEIVEIETDKTNQIIYAPAGGTVHYTAGVGDTVKIGQVIGLVEELADVSENVKVPKAIPPKTVSTMPIAPESSTNLADTPRAVSSEAPKIAPSHLQGVAVMEQATTSSLPPSIESKSGREVRKKMTTIRRVIAARLVEVKNQTALLTTFNEVDMSEVIKVREQEQESFQKKHGIKLGFMSFFIKASAAALQEFPDINARIDRDEIVYPQYFDIGVAVNTERGLMVPVIRGAAALSFANIEKTLKNFADQARNGTISIDQIQGGTFTITNGGVFGSLFSTPILNPPQSGILGMHNIVKRPIALNDEVVIRPMMYLALSYDHRIVDGRTSILFLMHIKKNIEDPSRLLLDL